MRSRNILLAGAFALLVSVSAPTAAQATTCNGARLKLTSGSMSACYGPGSHGVDNQRTTSIEVAEGYQATLHTRAAAPKTYFPGTHITDTNAATQIVVVKF
ncbi:hypothetical protein GCM10022247_58080 [Allokutzneria multivorans]|uniref:Uncharacterized protein n=1 Tax=Allokutzneria multivorans TaxID=1142134 RepID=A0ABP7TFZ2_9PSEU